MDAIREELERYTSLMTRIERLDNLLREVAASGVVFEDERVGYVEVQIDRDTWLELQRNYPLQTDTR
jgi:hypothetical protein